MWMNTDVDQHRGEVSKFAMTFDLTSTALGANFFREVLALNQLVNFLRWVSRLYDAYPSRFWESVLVLYVFS